MLSLSAIHSYIFYSVFTSLTYIKRLYKKEGAVALKSEAIAIPAFFVNEKIADNYYSINLSH